MEPVERLNCLGMRCPRPIIELAKAAHRHLPGAIVEILADDLAFESDVRAWCETTGAQLIELSRSGESWIATICLSTRKRNLNGQ